MAKTEEKGGEKFRTAACIGSSLDKKTSFSVSFLTLDLSKVFREG
jgi:hypothetical protein